MEFKAINGNLYFVNHETTQADASARAHHDHRALRYTQTYARIKTRL